MHDSAYLYVRTTREMLPKPSQLVEIGGRNINGSVRELFPDATYVSLDLEDGPGVDVVCDAREWQPSAPIDMVLCLEVLEHAPDPIGLISAAYRWLRVGGWLVVTAASPGRAPHSGHDGGSLRAGEHYQNISFAQLDYWLNGAFRWHQIEEHPERGDIYAVAMR